MISSFVNFFLAWPFWTYKINIESALENYFLKSWVTILSGKILFINLLTKLPCNYIRLADADSGFSFYYITYSVILISYCI